MFDVYFNHWKFYSADICSIIGSDKDITCEQIENGIREACDYVSDVTLFDVYEGVQLPPNKKSMAYSVVFTPKDEELKTKKVEGFVKDILAHLKETAGITLRG